MSPCKAPCRPPYDSIIPHILTYTRINSSMNSPHIPLYTCIGIVCLRALGGFLHKQLFSIISCRNTDVIMVRPRMHSKSCALVPRTLSWFGHGCFGNRVHFQDGRFDGWAMDACEIVRTRTLAVIMVRPWLLWSQEAGALKQTIPTCIYPICTQKLQERSPRPNKNKVHKLLHGRRLRRQSGFHAKKGILDSCHPFCELKLLARLD